MSVSSGRIKITRGRYLLALCSLATGVALLVYFLASLSLWLALLFTLSLAGGAAFLVWRLLAPSARAEARRRIGAGLLAGLLATLGYDLSRFLLVRLASFSLWPFDTFQLFGQLLLGKESSAPAALLAGTAYHLANGLSFAVAYALLMGERGWKAGIAWAMGLELLMVSFYPGWLGLKALDEFLTISVLGHVVYGGLLGGVSRKLLARPLARRGGDA